MGSLARDTFAQVKGTDFVSDEIFYFSKYRGWTRYRIAAGVPKQVGKSLAADLYYQSEYNATGSQPAPIHTIAIILELRLR